VVGFCEYSDEPLVSGTTELVASYSAGSKHFLSWNQKFLEVL
jgi:hypothetical protein